MNWLKPKKNNAQNVEALSSTRSSALSASRGVVGQPAASNISDNQLIADSINDTSWTYANTTTYTAGGLTSIGTSSSWVYTDANQASVYRWGGQVFLQPSTKLRALMTALQIL